MSAIEAIGLVAYLAGAAMVWPVAYERLRAREMRRHPELGWSAKDAWLAGAIAACDALLWPITVIGWIRGRSSA